MQKDRAFTLIELLVVMAVISILAAIIFPVFAQAKAAAHTTQCLSNNRQIGMAATLYLEDHDGLVPNATDGTMGAGREGGWVYYKVFDDVFDVKKGSLYPYVRSERLYVCPSDGLGRRSGLIYGINNCLHDITYLETYGFSAGLSTSLFEQPSETMFFGEEGTLGMFAPDHTNDGYLNIAVDHLSVRHAKGLTVVFLDGHAKRHSREQVLDQGYWSGKLAKCPGH